MDTSQPLVDFSVIIPVYRSVAELERCLKSLRKNDLIRKSELIVVDDASPGVGKALEEIARRHGAAYHRLPLNAGPGVARNRGVELAQGDILVFIDADCVAPPDWLERITRPVRAGEAAVTTACYSAPVTANWLTVFQNEDYRYRMPAKECSTYFLNSCNMAITRNALLGSAGFPRQRVSEDMVLGIRLARRGTPARYLPDAGVRHDYHRDFRPYLRQRYAFAYHAMQSHLRTRSPETVEPSSRVRSFNPLRVAAGMLFSSLMLAAFLGAAALAGLLSPSLAALLTWIGLGFLLLEGGIHGGFLWYLTRRQGLIRALSYAGLLYLLDLVYLFATLMALKDSWRGDGRGQMVNA